jgi:hypothetical protein
MRTFRFEVALVAGVLVLLAATPPRAQPSDNGSYRVQGEIRRGPDGKLILVRPPPPATAPAPVAAPPIPAATTPAGKASPKPAATTPTAAKAPPPASAPEKVAKTPEDLDKVSCEVIAWQPGTRLDSCLAAMREARAKHGS